MILILECVANRQSQATAYRFGTRFYADETGMDKTMEAARPVSGAYERRRVEQRQGKRAGCNEVRGKGTIRLLLCDDYRYRIGHISAARQMANGVALAGRVRLVMVAGRHIVACGKLLMLRMCGRGCVLGMVRAWFILLRHRCMAIPAFRLHGNRSSQSTAAE